MYYSFGKNNSNTYVIILISYYVYISNNTKYNNIIILCTARMMWRHLALRHNILEHFEIMAQNFRTCFGKWNIILLRDMNISVPHLIAEQMGRGIHISHKGAVGVPQIMIFKFYMELLFQHTGMVLHGIHCLHLSIR